MTFKLSELNVEDSKPIAETCTNKKNWDQNYLFILKKKEALSQVILKIKNIKLDQTFKAYFGSLEDFLR